tara:strand:- start:258 stop:1292 length:1035 start_codon:yes stop_codon:yes gene_type:complete
MLSFFGKPIRFDFLLMALVCMYSASLWLIATYHGYGDEFSPMISLGAAIKVSIVMGILYVFYVIFKLAANFIIYLPGNPIEVNKEYLINGPFNKKRYTQSAIVFFAYFVFISSFSSFKSLIGKMHPFSWDMYFMELDRKIHFGVDPWRLIHPFYSDPSILQIVAFLYIAWLPIFFFILYKQLFGLKNRVLRAQYLLAFFLTWAINGSYFAFIFSSAGPCYFNFITGIDHYSELMSYQYELNKTREILSVNIQSNLWDIFIGNQKNLIAGISAFPSIHVSTTFLFVLLSRHARKRTFITSVGFLLVIMMGSIYLGWHYAVDGYFGILTTLIIWLVSGYIARRIKV